MQYIKFLGHKYVVQIEGVLKEDKIFLILKLNYWHFGINGHEWKPC